MLCFHLNLIANLHWERGDTEQCIELYEEMARISRSINYAVGLSLATKGLGDLLLSLNRGDEALPYLTENAALSTQLHNPGEAAHSWTQVAKIHQQAGRIAEAATAWETVQHLRENENDFGAEIENPAGPRLIPDNLLDLSPEPVEPAESAAP